jgi:hypothetical protein
MATVEESALEYHKAEDGDGEYGCPGVECPGVQRLAAFWSPVIAEAESRGEARGRAAVLAEVAKLPSPWHLSRRRHSPDSGSGEEATETFWLYECSWCRCQHSHVGVYGDQDPNFAHPNNDCLWAWAHAAGVAAPEER